MSVLQASVAPIRASIDRLIPRGALVLTVLSLGYFAMGIVRNRVFANTYGAGAELDAYNAAFRIPEIALDVLVAAGLTAPFVPIFSSLRQETGDDGVANEFGRTVLTGAVAVMAVASVLIFLGAPWLADRIGAGFDPATRELTVEMMRINCIAQVMFAASIALGEVLVANRRFVFYALAPILYTTGIVVATVLFAGRYGIVATAWGAVVGAVAHLGIRAIGTLRTTFRIRPGFAVRTAAFAEFVRLMIPRMVSLPIDPITAAWFTLLATGLGVGSVSAYSFASDYQVLPVSLIGVSFSLAIFPTLSAAFAAGDGRTFRAELGRNLATIAILTGLAAVALFVLSGTLVEVLLGGGRFGPDDVARTSAVVAAFALSVPFDALAYPLSRGLYATHDTLRQVVASFAGLGVVIVASSALVPSVGILAIPFGYAAGTIVKDVLLAVFLRPRIRRMAVSSPA
ncbi:MAG TPA: lipid II flippase MurJ [Candidatus Limnocylindrales bacterium]|nr:lipid II flippase MurJ [Candidatus Limnocylindrales bacterium]